MTYDAIKISETPELTVPDDSIDIVLGDGDYVKRINYKVVKDDICGSEPLYTEDSTPYMTRQTKDSGIVGKVAMEQIVGGSLGWNQLVQNGNFASTSNWYAGNGGTLSVSNNEATITANGGAWNVSLQQNTQAGRGHKVVLTAQVKGTGGLIGKRVTIHADGATDGNPFTLTSAYVSIADVINVPSTSTYVRITNQESFNGLSGAYSVKNFMLIDLTLAFGSTIADYIYNLETATAGAGIAKLKSWGIDLDTYHAYDAGSIQSVEATSHVTTVRNLFALTSLKNADFMYQLGATYYAGLGGSSFSISGDTLSVARASVNDAVFVCIGKCNAGSPVAVSFNVAQGVAYDIDARTLPPTNAPDNNTRFYRYLIPSGTTRVEHVFTPSSNGYVYIEVYATSGNLSNVLTNIKLEYGSEVTAYEPIHVYPLGSDTLRGIPQLVNNELQYDGDVKTADGTINRKYGIVDLGTLTFTANGTITGGYQYVATIPNKAYGVDGFICPKFVVSASNELWTMYGRAANAIISFNSTESTAAAFKTAMSGVYLVYPLATPTTESGTAYQRVQTVDADGTESFTTNTVVPPGHRTVIPENVLGALVMIAGD